MQYSGGHRSFSWAISERVFLTLKLPMLSSRPSALTSTRASGTDLAAIQTMATRREHSTTKCLPMVAIVRIYTAYISRARCTYDLTYGTLSGETKQVSLHLSSISAQCNMPISKNSVGHQSICHCNAIRVYSVQ